MREALRLFELRLVKWVATFEGRPLLRAWMLASTRAGDGWALVVMVPLALAVGRARGVAVVACGVVSAVTTALVVHGIKAAVRRRRPEGVSLLRPIGAPDLHAFPSGHTAHAFGLLVLGWWLSPWLGVALVPVALSVGLSRVFFGLHYPTDVVAGAALGAGLALVTLLLAELTGLVNWIQRIGV